MEMQKRGQPCGDCDETSQNKQADTDQLPIDADQAARPEMTGNRDAAEPNSVRPPAPFLGAADGVQKRQSDEQNAAKRHRKAGSGVHSVGGRSGEGGRPVGMSRSNRDSGEAPD